MTIRWSAHECRCFRISTHILKYLVSKVSSFRQIISLLQFRKSVLLQTDSIDVDESGCIHRVEIQYVHRGLGLIIQLLSLRASAHYVTIALVKSDLDLAVLQSMS